MNWWRRRRCGSQPCVDDGEVAGAGVAEVDGEATSRSGDGGGVEEAAAMALSVGDARARGGRGASRGAPLRVGARGRSSSVVVVDVSRVVEDLD
jgi:hypothetical protein